MFHFGARPARDSFCAVRALEALAAGRSTRALEVPMSPHQIVGLAVRLFAIWLALQGAPLLVEASQMPMEGGPAVSYVMGAAFIVVALALWLFPMSRCTRASCASSTR
jgi:hypothetical protein